KTPALGAGVFASRRDPPPIRSDRFLQLLRGPEYDLLARLDFDRLAGRGVAAHAGCALAHLKDAETADADPIALLQVFHDKPDHVVEHRVDLLLGHLM